MTEEQRVKVLQAIRQSTEKHAKTPETARAYLISLGIYNSDGSLAPEYGGERAGPRPP